MTRREIHPRSDVSYVRDRIWLVCVGCGRSLVTDRRELEQLGREGSNLQPPG